MTAAKRKPAGAEGELWLRSELPPFTPVVNEFLDHAAASHETKDPVSTQACWLYVILKWRSWGDTREVRVSYDKLREMTGFHRDTIRKALKRLVADGWVEAVRNYNRPTVYQVNMTRRGPEASSPRSGTASSPRSGTASSPRSGTAVVPEVGRYSKKPLQEAAATRAAGAAAAGGGEEAPGLNPATEANMHALVAAGVSRNKRTWALAGKLAAYPHAPDVIAKLAAEMASNPKLRNRAGVLVDALAQMTPSDWQAAAPKPRRVLKVVD